jgi:copper chaperone CopZ
MKENITLKVGGMHCSNCELAIEKRMSSLDGISNVKASFNKEEVNVRPGKKTR